MQASGRQSWCVFLAVILAAGGRPAQAAEESCKNAEGLTEVIRSSTTDPAGQVLRGATTALLDSEGCVSAAGSRYDVAMLLMNIAQEVLESPHEGDLAWICGETAPVLDRYAAENHGDGERAKRAIAAIRGFADRLAREQVCGTKEGPEPPNDPPTTTEVRAPHNARRQAGIVLLGVGSTALVAGFVMSGFVVDAEKERVRNGVDSREEDMALWDRGWRLWGAQVSLYAVAGVLLVTGTALVLKAHQTKKRRKGLVNLQFRPGVAGLQFAF